MTRRQRRAFIHDARERGRQPSRQEVVMFIAIMQNSWGRGTVKEEAVKIAAKEGGHGRKRAPRLVFQYDPAKTTSAYVDELGRLCWVGDRPVEVERVGLPKPAAQVSP